MSYGAFGQRRKEAGWSGNPLPADWTEITDTTRRGFTFHEMLDNLNLIHMNGRVYDQIVGRFLSADPIVQAPAFTQSFNRYSYVFNNPLTFTIHAGIAAQHISGEEVREAGRVLALVPNASARNPCRLRMIGEFERTGDPLNVCLGTAYAGAIASGEMDVGDTFQATMRRTLLGTVVVAVRASPDIH